MNALRRRLARARSGDSGVTLTELVVTMSIMGILISVVAVVIVQAYRLQGQTVSRESDTTDAQVAMDTMSRALRQATYVNDVPAATLSKTDPPNKPAFTQLAPTAVTFTSLTGATPDPANLTAAGDPVQVTYSLSASGVLTQLVRQPKVAGQGKYSTFLTTGGATRVIARNVVATSTAPLFSYVYKQADGKLSTTVPAIGADLLVRQVRIQLTVDTDGAGPLAGTTLDSTVANLNLNQ